MKHIYNVALMLLLLIASIFAEEKKALVEIFTNSHCPLCPPAHSAIDKYLQTNNSDKIEYIFYHMQFPYSTDKLYQHNIADSQSKNTFYGPYSSTPQAFFNGTHKSNNYSQWSSELDVLVAEQSKIDITLVGSKNINAFTITAEVKKTSTINQNDLTINFVIVENISNYTGQNGISSHKNVMRKIVNPVGNLFEINLNETKQLSETINFNSEWNKDNLKIIAFVQSSSTKEIFQSASITYNALVTTGVNDKDIVPQKFSLEQNYPNPFNPSTTINYSIPVKASRKATEQLVTLKIYDTLGRVIATLINKEHLPGNYSIKYDAKNLTSGIYIYRLQSGSFAESKKMSLLK